MSDKFKDIHESHAARKLNILKGFTDFGDIVKGHMDFGSGGDKKDKPKSQLVQKKVTDRRGHQTTRWVKNGEDPKAEKKTPMGGEEEDKGGAQSNQKEGGVQKQQASPDSSQKQNDGTAEQQFNQPRNQGDHSEDELRDFASQLTDEQLQDFITKNSEIGERMAEVEIAQEELDHRNAVDGDIAAGEEPYQTPSGATLDSYYALDEEGQRSVLEASMKHNIPLGAALAMVMEASGNSNNEETHAKIDAAQAALNDLKGATGHPEAGEGTPGPDMDGDAENQFEQAFVDWMNETDQDPDELQHLVDEIYKTGQYSKDEVAEIASRQTGDGALIGAVKEAWEDAHEYYNAFDDPENNNPDSFKKEGREGDISPEQADAYDHMDIGQFSMPQKNWDKYSDEELEALGRKIVAEQYGGDVEAAYNEVVHGVKENEADFGEEKEYADDDERKYNDPNNENDSRDYGLGKKKNTEDDDDDDEDADADEYERKRNEDAERGVDKQETSTDYSEDDEKGSNLAERAKDFGEGNEEDYLEILKMLPEEDFDIVPKKLKSFESEEEENKYIEGMANEIARVYEIDPKKAKSIADLIRAKNF